MSSTAFSIHQKQSVKYLACTAVDEMDFMVHAFCTRQGGTSDGSFASLNVSVRAGDGEEPVHRNFKRIAEAFGISASQFLLIDQVHQDGVWTIDSQTPLGMEAPPPAVDAVVTDRPGIALCIKTADCVPVFLIDPIRRIVSAVHAGWKGTALRIVEQTVETMGRQFGVQPADLFAFIGPSIGPCCYEVDAVVYQAMHHHRSPDAFFHPGREAGRWMLDLPLANRFQLLDAGLLPERIRATDLCTACHPELFFSHRAQNGYTGRQLNFIMIR